MKEELARTIRHYNQKGWSPATSTNYSFRDETEQIWVSRSGVDKQEFSAADFMTINENGEATGDYAHVRPSAETLIHTQLYALFPDIKVILHSHSAFPLVVTETLDSAISFTGYEVQKGFEGITTHDCTVDIPVFNNTQDMVEFASWLRARKSELKYHALIIRNHGTYAWGKSLFDAKRHLETLEYLCYCDYLKA
jgi:methylthioribulose-1-phosphate dehydratase